MRNVLQYLFVFILTISFTINEAQVFNSSVKGRVIDKQTGEQLFNTNIYLSGTEWGTTSNKNGYYSIKNIIPSEYQIVFSLIGYETKSKIITFKNSSEIELDIELTSKSYELENIIVDSEYPDIWYEDLKLFKKYFLGNTKFADKCIIENEIYLDFSRSTSNILTAKISRPLIIYNHALGYKINCELINFKFDSDEKRVKYLITTHFTKLDTLDENVVREWNKNRNEAYLGSLQHFLYSLNYNSFLEEGFEVSTSIVPSKERFNLFREKIYTSDSLLTKSFLPEHKSLHFNKYLQIQYNKSNNDRKPISWLKVLGIDVNLDKYGTPIEIMPFELHGYWSQSGLSDMLPKYYFILKNEIDIN